MVKPTPEQIVELLHSITKLSIDDGELTVYFDHTDEPFSSTEYKENTFTRDLIELIEYHLLVKKDK